MLSAKLEKRSRNSPVECGPVYCEGCHLFFHEKRQSFANYTSAKGSPCYQHRGKEGFRLIDLLNKEEKNESFVGRAVGG